MTSFGEHACIVGAAAALQLQDWLYTQYREQGAFLWRGYTIDEVINQCIGNVIDAGKGRQMPVHYGSKKLNMPTISSPLSITVTTKLHKYRRQQAPAMPSGQPGKIESAQSTLGKELLQRATVRLR